MSELIDVGYRDPWDEREPEPAERPSPAEYTDDFRALPRAELEQLLAFGAGAEQVLARAELGRRAGTGYQPSLLGSAERLAETAPRRGR